MEFCSMQNCCDLPISAMLQNYPLIQPLSPVEGRGDQEGRPAPVSQKTTPARRAG
jgi:hypothetical protein